TGLWKLGPTMQAAVRVAARITEIDGFSFFIGGSGNRKAAGLDALRYSSSQSPGAGAGLPGNPSAACGLLAPDHFSTRVKRAGTRRMSTLLASSMPPITVVPMIWRATEPAPEAVHSGTQPRMKANEVIITGRRRSLA